jgi:hypothetical protein
LLISLRTVVSLRELRSQRPSNKAKTGSLEKQAELFKLTPS